MAISTRSASSKTAHLVAAYRARSTERAPPVCRDVWAGRLAGEEGFELARRHDRIAPHSELFTAVRTAFIDGEVETAIARGLSQVVILGAGLDTRAARLASRGVRFFEVDHPSSQAEKLARLRALEAYPLEAATYVSCDFEREDFLDRLGASGFDRAQAAFFVWEGVAMYLTEAAVRATLERVAKGTLPASAIVFDYLSKRFAEGATSQQQDVEQRAFLDELGEPVIFGLNDAVPFVYAAGFRHLRAVSFDEACLTLTGTYDRARLFRFAHIALASVEPPRREGR